MELQKQMIKLDQQIATKEEAIRAAGQVLVDNGIVESEYIEAMIERDADVSTFMGNFIAIPHGTDEGRQYIKKTGISVLQLPQGVNFTPEQETESLALMVFGIAGINNEHLDLLSKIAIVCSDEKNVARLVNATTEEEIIQIFEEEG